MPEEPKSPAAQLAAPGPPEPGVKEVSLRNLNILLGLMLLTLHGAIAWGTGEWWQRGLLLAHFGLFLLWQPVWRGERNIPDAQALLVLCMGIFFSISGNWWLLATWVAVLFGLIGGAVPGTVGGRDRFVAILAAVYLVTMLLLWVVPQLFTSFSMMTEVSGFVRFLMPLLPLVILAIPKGERRPGAPVIVDLFYSVVLFLLVVALALGSFVIQEVSHGQYLLGLAQALIVIALLLLGLSWLWNPHAGFGGLGTLLSRYLLGLGLPFEQRMRHLAELAEVETRPEPFLRSALTYMLELPWVTGFGWTSPWSSGTVGREDTHAEQYETDSLRVTVFAPRLRQQAQGSRPAVTMRLRRV